MYATDKPKKLLILDILDILRRYTDENHRLTQKQIADILKEEYGMSADRKAIRRNIMNLIDAGNHIEYTEKIRKMPLQDKDGNPVIDPDTGKPLYEENTIWTDFYLDRDITDGELRLLIDYLFSMNYIPSGQCRELIAKLENLSREKFKDQMAHASKIPLSHANNSQFFYNVEQLHKAINQNRKVTFKYTEYGTDRKIHFRQRPDGSIRIYKATPYQMAVKEGKYYLICNYDKYNDISNYRIDRIRDVEITNEPGKPFEELEWSDGHPFYLDQYMEEHIYMFSSKTSRVEFRIKKPLLSDVIDLFGTNIHLHDETDDEITVSAWATEEAVEQFAKVCLPDVVILSPQRLADKMKQELKDAIQKYKLYE